MKTYLVEIIETMSKIVEIIADNEDEAINNVKQKYNNEDFVLDYDNFVEAKFNIVKE